MSLKGYLVVMAICTLFSLVALGTILVYVEPSTAGFFGLLLFYLSLFFSLGGLLTLGGFFLRRKFQKGKPSFVQASVSFWQGLIFALVIIGILILQKYVR